MYVNCSFQHPIFYFLKNINSKIVQTILQLKTIECCCKYLPSILIEGVMNIIFEDGPFSGHVVAPKICQVSFVYFCLEYHSLTQKRLLLCGRYIQHGCLVLYLSEATP